MSAPFNAMTEQETVEAIVEGAQSGVGRWVITANLDHLRRYYREPLARSLIGQADLVVADGMPLIWASRIAGATLPERVAGSNMVWSIANLAARQGVSLFLLGGDNGVAEKAARVLTSRFSSLEIAGTTCPPHGFESQQSEYARIVERLDSTSPGIVLVALGFPKQDVLIARLRQVRPQTSFVGVGISLSFVAGEVQRAPNWMHTLGLEWIHRLSQEPRRLFRRYLAQGMPFASMLALSAARHRLHTAVGLTPPPGQWGTEEPRAATTASDIGHD